MAVRSGSAIARPSRWNWPVSLSHRERYSDQEVQVRKRGLAAPSASQRNGASALRKVGNGALRYVGINPCNDKDERSGAGLSQANRAERTTRLAKRIWQAFARYRWTTSKVTLPPWEAMDEDQRNNLITLAAEALGSEGADLDH